MTQFAIDLTGEQHKDIEQRAAEHGLRLQEYVITKLFPAKDNDMTLWDDLHEHLSDRILQAENGHTVQQTFAEISEEILIDPGTN